MTIFASLGFLRRIVLSHIPVFFFFSADQFRNLALLTLVLGVWIDLVPYFSVEFCMSYCNKPDFSILLLYNLGIFEYNHRTLFVNKTRKCEIFKLFCPYIAIIVRSKSSLLSDLYHSQVTLGFSLVCKDLLLYFATQPRNHCVTKQVTDCCFQLRYVRTAPLAWRPTPQSPNNQIML